MVLLKYIEKLQTPVLPVAKSLLQPTNYCDRTKPDSPNHIMTTFAVSSRLSPFSLSLFAPSPSPPSLPRLPTLAELQKHAHAMTSYMPSVSGPSASATPVTQPKTDTSTERVIPWMFGGGTPPPTYSQNDPFNKSTAKEGGKLKKTGRMTKMGWSRAGWARMPEGGIDPSIKRSMPRVQGESASTLGSESNVHAEMGEGTAQPSVDDVQVIEKEDEKGSWWEW